MTKFMGTTLMLVVKNKNKTLFSCAVMHSRTSAYIIYLFATWNNIINQLDALSFFLWLVVILNKKQIYVCQYYSRTKLGCAQLEKSIRFVLNN